MAKMTAGQGVTVGPILLSVNAPAHILTLSATVRRVVKITALVVAHAGAHAGALTARRNAAWLGARPLRRIDRG